MWDLPLEWNLPKLKFTMISKVGTDVSNIPTLNADELITITAKNLETKFIAMMTPIYTFMHDILFW